MQLADGGYPQTIATLAEILGVRHDKSNFTLIIGMPKHQRRTIGPSARLQFPAKAQ